MLNYLCLCDVKVSELNNIPNVRILMIKNLEFDEDLSCLNLPVMLEKLIIIGINYICNVANCYICCMNILNFQKIIKTAKMPFNCELYIETLLNDSLLNMGKIAFYINDKIEIYNKPKNNIEMQIICNNAKIISKIIEKIYDL